MAAIYGGNASGKTNVVRALYFMRGAIVNSHRLWKPDGGVPRDPFSFDPSAKEAPSSFSVDVMIDSQHFQYGFKVDDHCIVAEWLYAFVSGRKQTWFSRKLGRPVLFGRRLVGPSKRIEELMRDNSLFLSAAAQNGHKALLPIFRFFSTGLRFETDDRGITPRILSRLHNDERLRVEVSEFLTIADMGVSSIRTKSRQLKEGERERFKAVLSALGVNENANEFVETAETIASTSIELLHSVGGREVALDLGDESSGTRALLALAVPIIQALKQGMVVCVDELESSLHPVLASWLVRRFQDTKSNPNGAQLIFNTHETQLLGGGLLRRDQVWFTEKDSNGASHLYPLSDFRSQPNENPETGYMQGRYGAIPFLNSDAFLSAMAEKYGKK